MANIKVNDLSNLNPTGTDLFDDPESFITDLNEEDEQIDGGRYLITNCPIISNCTIRTHCGGESVAIL